jgi:hypothetical protein
MKKIIRALPVLAVVFLAASSALAQNNASLDQISRDPNKAVKADQNTAAAAAAAAELTAGATVSFEEVLAAPDDIELNERYALGLVRTGDLRGAATTLERVLLNSPGRVRTRLLYGIVLLRLDDAPDAVRELSQTLESPDLPAELRLQAEAYKALARSRLRDSHFDARLTMGGGFDSNRNVAPDSQTSMIFGTLVPVTPGPTPDGNFQFIGTVGASYDFDGPHGDTLFARFTDFRQDQHVISLLSLQVYSPQVGATIRTPWVDITPSYSYSYVDLSIPMALYLRSHDYDLRVSRRWDRTMETWADITDSRQVFYNTPLIVNGSDRSGDQINFGVGANWTPDPADRISLTLVHQRKFAVQTFDAYRREGVTLDYTHLFDHGVFTTVGLTADYDRYEQPEFLVGSMTRSDDGYIPHFTVGAPLEPLWHGLKGFTGTLGLLYTSESSSIVNYQYTNVELNALLSYQWGI